MLDRVKDNPNICGIELGFSGELYATSNTEWQPFYNSSMFAINFTKTHIALGSVSFSEEYDDNPAGTSYKQTVSIRFPSTDSNRSQRLALINDVRFVKVKLTNGLDLVIGRNDFSQNARPKIKIKTNSKTAEAVFETVSIFPTGFVADDKAIGFPSLIPILFNL